MSMDMLMDLNKEYLRDLGEEMDALITLIKLGINGNFIRKASFTVSFLRCVRAGRRHLHLEAGQGHPGQDHQQEGQ